MDGYRSAHNIPGQAENRDGQESARKQADDVICIPVFFRHPHSEIHKTEGENRKSTNYMIKYKPRHLKRPQQQGFSPIRKKAGGNIVGRMAILAEGEAAGRKDIIYLEKLPLFKSDGTPIE